VSAVELHHSSRALVRHSCCCTAFHRPTSAGTPSGSGCSATTFHEQVGLSPKAVARLVRCEHAVSLVRVGKSLSEVAYEACYSDQPHFNRDFRDLVGCAPTDFPFVQDGVVTA
jgi:hypothetical protein